MLKIIFLDIDGVLNHQKFYERRHFRRKFTIPYWWFRIKRKLVKPKATKISSKLSKKINTFNYKFQRFKHETDPLCLYLLNDLCEGDTSIKIVISSTWRNYFTIQEWNTTFQLLGCSHIHVIGVTTRTGSIRGHEIQLYINEHQKQIANYVILDDDSDMLPEQTDHFFWIDSYVGLTPTIIYKIKRFFKYGQQKIF